MFRKLSKLFILILFLVASSLATQNYTFSQYAFADSTPSTLSALSYDEALHADLQNVQDFTIFNGNFLFVSANVLYQTNLTTGITTQVGNYVNVSNLTSNDTYISFLENNMLVLLNENLQEQVLTFHTVESNFLGSLFGVISSQTNNILAVLNDTTLTLVQFNVNLEITSQQNIPLNTITNPIDITVSNEYVYLSNGTSSNYLFQISISNISQQSNLNTGLLNTSDITFANLYDNNLFFNIYRNHTMLNVFTIDNSSETPNISTLASLTISDILTPSFTVGDLSEIYSIHIVDNHLYVLDTINKTLQAFTIIKSNDIYSLTLDKVVIASSGYDAGRFFAPTDMYVASDTSYVVADTQNSRIQSINNQTLQTLTSVTSATNDTTTLNYPASVAYDTNKKLVVYNQPLGLNQVLISKNSVLLAKIETYHDGANSVALGTLSNLTLNTDNTIYTLDLTNNQILFSQNYNEFQILKASPFATALNANSKIVATKNLLLVLHDNKLYLLDAQGNQLFELALENAVTDLDVDFMQNIYALTANNIEKYVISDNEITYDSNLTLENANTFSMLRVAKDSGKFVLYHDNNEQLYTLSNTDFSQGLTNYVYPTLVNSAVANTQIATIATLNTASYLYAYPDYTGTSYALQQNQIVYALNSENGFDYVLVNQNGTLLAGYIPTNSTTVQNIDAVSFNYVAISNTVALFKYPTLLQTQDQQSLILETVQKDTLLNVISPAILSLDGSSYYAVNKDNAVLYVNVADVVLANTAQVQPLTPTNAQVFSMSGETLVYQSNSATSTVLTTLPNFSHIVVVDYNSETEWTQIIYKNELNQEISGYILTQNVWNEEDTSNNLTAIILTISGLALLIATAVVFIKVKKSKEL